MTPQRKVALVLGGARMGLAVGRALAPEGFDIVLGYRSSRATALKDAAELTDAGYRASTARCDLSNPGSIVRLADHLRRRVGRLDVLVNLASIYERNEGRPEPARASWDGHMAANARGAFLLSLALAPLMTVSGGGRMILVSDWTGASGRPRYRDYEAYYVSKTAVKGVVEALALRLAPSILVNGIAPGPMLPPRGMSAGERRAVERATPLGRWGGADEIAKAALFLIRTAFVTGETIRVDGGRHLL